MQTFTSSRPHIVAQQKRERRISKGWGYFFLINNTIAVYIVAITGYFVALAVVA